MANLRSVAMIRIAMLWVAAGLLLAACGTSSPPSEADEVPASPRKPRFAGYRQGAMILYDEATKGVFAYEHQAFSYKRRSPGELLWESDSLTLLTPRRDSATTLEVVVHSSGATRSFRYDAPVSQAVPFAGFVWVSCTNGTVWRSSLATGQTEAFGGAGQNKRQLCGATRDTLFMATTYPGQKGQADIVRLTYLTQNLKDGGALASHISGHQLIPSRSGRYWTDDLPGAGDSLMIFNKAMLRFKKKSKKAGSFNFVFEYPNSQRHELVSYSPDNEQLSITYFDAKAFYLRSLDPADKAKSATATASQAPPASANEE